MTQPAPTLPGRLLCACNAAYGIDGSGKFTKSQPYWAGVGWDASHAPKPIVGGVRDGPRKTLDIDAALVGKSQDGIVVAFRGTLPPEPVTPASLADWWEDIVDSKPERKGSLPGKVHHGFWDAVETLWADLTAAIAEFQGWFPEAPILVTGHSKGGPMATLTAARLYFGGASGMVPRAVQTFASPHPGDTAFASGFPLAAIPVTRFENHLDIVPFLPPEEEFIELARKIPLIGRLFALAEGWDYAPLGTLRYARADHRVVGDEPGLEDLRLLEFVESMLEDDFGAIAAAHSIDCGTGYQKGVMPTGVCGGS